MPPGGPPWASAEKPKSLWKTLWILLKYIGEFKWHIIAGIVFSLLSSVTLLLAPQYLADMTDGISSGIESGGMDFGPIAAAGIVLVVLYLLNMAFRTMESYVVPCASERNGNIMRKDLSAKLFRIPLRILDRMSAGDVMSRFTNDTDTIRTQSAECICDLVTALSMMVGSAIMMLITDSNLAVVSLIPVLIGFGLMLAIIKKSQKYFVAQAKNLGRMNSLVEEMYYGMDIVNTYNDGDHAMEIFDEINDSLYKSAFTTRFVSSLMPRMMDFLSNLGYVVVCVFGSAMILDGKIGFGVLVAFIVYVKQFTDPLLRLSDTLASMQSVAASAERVFELLGTEEMEDESRKTREAPSVEGHVSFDHVCFSYDKGTPVIQDLCLDVHPGEKVAIVGPTGAGKSTIANILMRFYELDSGKITIEGVDISEMTRETLRSLFCMVPQESWTFGASIKENISLGKKDVSDERIKEVCEAIGADQFIETLDEGYDTVLNESVQLSAGQKQLLMIARAMVRDAPLLILDEATSSVDTNLEKKVEAAMDRLKEDKASFIIAHRLSTIKDADVILVVKDGRIEEKGTFKELLSANGFFRTLYDSQFEGCD
ncbi:MAG: ABC transporter ATP-binding protein [Candidatus Methanomethylophilaceae archaeon]|nr:ABC transporter ATP-binding protein [Candidatus Methanomethylophilaceae archaeon]